MPRPRPVGHAGLGRAGLGGAIPGACGPDNGGGHGPSQGPARAGAAAGTAPGAGDRIRGRPSLPYPRPSRPPSSPPRLLPRCQSGAASPLIPTPSDSLRLGPAPEPRTAGPDTRAGGARTGRRRQAWLWDDNPLLVGRPGVCTVPPLPAPPAAVDTRALVCAPLSASAHIIRARTRMWSRARTRARKHRRTPTDGHTAARNHARSRRRAPARAHPRGTGGRRQRAHRSSPRPDGGCRAVSYGGGRAGPPSPARLPRCLRAR